jgi:hypothetical protein
MAGLMDRFRGLIGTPRDKAKPFSEQGVGGFRVYGGYIATNETNTQLMGVQRFTHAADLLANVSIIAASLRYTLNLISRPHWRFEPADDSAEAKAAAEFMESVIDGIDASWTRIIRRTGMYRYHGFGVSEWVAKKREEDGKIGIASIESRPQHTIERWDIDDNGGVVGVWQRDPQTGLPIYLPRGKLLYIVDDTLTDSPEGMGWFRHLAEPARRLKSYLQLEGLGFERDLTGIPVGRAPMAKINQLVQDGKITAAQRDSMLGAIDQFVALKRKDQNTGIVLDSATQKARTETGETISSIYEWGIELLTGTQSSIDHLGEAIKRLQYDMALIMGTESMLTGRDGQGSRALSEDKSRNLYLIANATLADMAESVDRDLVAPIWTMNGLPDKLRPKAAVEDVAFKDAEAIAKVLADMATAGAILAPDDPAINDLRDLMGIEHAKPMDMAMANALQGRPDPTKPSPEASLADQRAKEIAAQGGGPDGGPGGPGGPGGANDNSKPGAKQPAAKAAPRTLYVRRQLLNPRPFIQWAKSNGFATTIPADDLHVTVCYSKRPMDWMAVPNDFMGDEKGHITVRGGPRLLDRFGDQGQVAVLLFNDYGLKWRHEAFMDAGASFDHPEYQPHISISWDAAGVDIDKIEPYQGDLVFGPEIFEEINPDWQAGLVEKAFNPNQPRDPAGSQTGGRWTAAGAGASAGDVVFEIAPNPDNKELTARWDSLSDEEKAKISTEIAQEFTPEILDKLGVKGTAVADAIGGFEGHTNPSFVLGVNERPFEVAGALGDAYSQKAMVVLGSAGQPGLDAIGSAFIVAPNASAEHLRKMEGQLGDIAGDGWTYHNGRMQILNFSGKSNADFAEEIDKRLGGAYDVEHATIHSALIERANYGSAGSDGRASAWGQVRDSTRERVSAALESALQKVGKRIAGTGEAGEGLKAYRPDQPRDPAGTSTGGRWTAAGGGHNEGGDPAKDGKVQPLTEASKEAMTNALEGKSLAELRAMAQVHQDRLRAVGQSIQKQLGVTFSDTEIKSEASAMRKIRDEGYAGPHKLTDLARVSFSVDNPADGNAVIQKLADAGFNVHDKGWKALKGTNYLDRKMLVQHTNGSIGEIQIIPRPLAAIKGVKGVPGGGVFNGAGHRLYEIARNPKKPKAVRDRATALSSKLYTRAVAGTPFAGMIN